MSRFAPFSRPVKTFGAALFGAWVLLGPSSSVQRVAAVQAPTTRIAFDQCGPDLDYWIVTCQIHTLVDGSDGVIAPGLGPKWSPDGSKLVFTGTNGGYGTVSFGLDEVVVANLADGSLANLTNHPASDVSPAWSPDGGRIAFVSNRNGSPDVYVMNADGSNVARVTHAPGFTGSFVWSPDGARIVFGSTDGGASDLYAIAADGSNLTRLTQNSGFTGQLAWSRDGARIAFACEPESGNGDICTINSDGTNFVRLTSDPAFDSSPSFSPVGDRIAFTTGGMLAITDGSGGVSPVGVAGDRPVWSPDATQLAFIGTTSSWLGRCYPGGGAQPADGFCLEVQDIYVVNVDGTGLTRIANGGGIDWFTPLPGRPLAAFTYDCVGTTCQFDASGSADTDGLIASYQWNFGDGTSGSSASTGHTYALGRGYAVTLTVTDDAGLTGTLTANVTANAAPVASFTALCNGATCAFDASASVDPDGAITAYVWDFGDGQRGYSPMLTHTYATTGTFTVRLLVWDDSGVGSVGLDQTNVTVLAVNVSPVASFSSLCPAVTCTFDASGSSDPDGTITSYAWNFGDGTTGSGVTVSHTYGTGGTYAVTLTVTDNAGTSATRAQSVTVVLPEMHVGDLDGSSTNQQNKWTAAVTIAVHDKLHGPVAGATMTGTWDDGSAGSCTTNASGVCTVSRSAVPKSTNRGTFTVRSVARSGFAYTPAANHDPDGSSSGTIITVQRP